MAADDHARLRDSLRRLPPGTPEQLRSHSTKGPFAELTELCISLFPDRIDTNRNGEPVKDDVRRGLLHLLEATGVPSTDAYAERVAAAIIAAMTEQGGEDIHLCPLDNVEDVPDMQFGPCAVRRFDESGFCQLIDAPRLERHFADYKIDAGRFAWFHWLVVRERVTFATRLGKRASPFRFLNFNEDFGAIKPFARNWPKIVDRAVLAMILLPMEDMVQHPDIDWRAFRIPWVYTVKADLLDAPTKPPTSDTLHWQPDIYIDQITGEDIESERPFVLPLEEAAGAQFATLDDSRWGSLEAGENSAIANPLAAHFLLRAFLNDEIDEFLAHVTAIEAAIGLQSDYGRPRRVPVSGNPGATERMARRVAGLLGDPGAAQQFHQLFNVRSDFVHGRPAADISSATRNLARTLARRVVDGLLDAGSRSAASRETFLSAFCP